MSTNESQAPESGADDDARRKREYRVMIDKTLFVLTEPVVTGRQLLVQAGKLPPEQFAIYIKLPGTQPKRIGLDESVDLRAPGVERFVTLPLDQTEGLDAPRRQFSLPAEDQEWLDGLGLTFELVTDPGQRRVIVHGLPVPAGYTVPSVSVSVRIEPGYPDVQIDMAYFRPALVLVSGRQINAICDEPFDGTIWQRWSRHRTPMNPWRPGIDSLSTHFALIQEWLEREANKA